MMKKRENKQWKMMKHMEKNDEWWKSEKNKIRWKKEKKQWQMMKNRETTMKHDENEGKKQWKIMKNKETPMNNYEK